jgi:tellurite resistance protein TerC
MSDTAILWISFNAFVLGMLALDLGVFHRKSHEVSVKEALLWTGAWIVLALLFNLFIYHHFNSDLAMEFLTGYLIEKSLSIDNIFVIIMIFSYFQVPAIHQHKVLFLGILGALVMRAILIFTGIRMFSSDSKIDPENNVFVRLVRKIIPITNSFQGDKFFVRNNGALWATPLFLVLIVIEGTDLIFAVDSIPAILSISEDPFIVYTSNVFAILGLRSLYFALAGIDKYFKHLKYGLAVILIFVGTKMAITDIFKIPVYISLLIIAFILAVSILVSILDTARKDDPTLADNGNGTQK